MSFERFGRGDHPLPWLREQADGDATSDDPQADDSDSAPVDAADDFEAGEAPAASHEPIVPELEEDDAQDLTATRRLPTVDRADATVEDDSGEGLFAEPVIRDTLPAPEQAGGEEAAAASSSPAFPNGVDATGTTSARLRLSDILREAERQRPAAEAETAAGPPAAPAVP
ncbi:MAG: hypothetical protein GEU28_11405, partial [Dehalococcoidia bacterium]|nr:hypothetical protein [Dehalococcoidia bacterium]